MTRSLWKGPFMDHFFIRSLRKGKNISPTFGSNMGNKSAEKLNSISIFGQSQKVWSRRSVILPQFLDSNFEIYNGKQFIKLRVTEDMIGHKFGEFALTRKKPKHPTLKKNLITKKK